MSVTSALAQIKVGVLLDMKWPRHPYWGNDLDILDAMRLTLDDAFQSGLVDRPIELVVRYVEGLPRGTVKAIIDGYKELVEEGCLVVYGPIISDNAPPLRDYIEREGRVPAITMGGTEDWLGEWTFGLANASMPDEPYVLANIMAHAGHRRVVVAMEKSLIGQQYLSFFREACDTEGVTIVAEAHVPQTGDNMLEQIGALREQKPDALVHFGFGWAVFGISKALEELNWTLPRYTTTAWEVGFITEEAQRLFTGWIGLEQYDEQNEVAVAFLDRFEKKYDRRPEYYAPVYGYDIANTIAHALSKAHPLSPQGVKEGLERVKMLPAACGAPGTRISFGKWTRRGWMGAGYLVAREFDPKTPTKTIFRGRIGPPAPRRGLK